MKNRKQNLNSWNKFSLYYLMLIVLLISCNKQKTEIILNEENSSELQYLIGSKKYSLEKESDIYTLIVDSTNLKTKLGREMAASVAAIKLYEELSANNSTLNFETSFKITFDNFKSNFTYNIENINDAINAQKIINNSIENIKNKKINLENLNCERNSEIENFQNLEFSDYGFGGFTQSMESICNINRKVTIWRIFLISEKKQLLFYVDKNGNKLIRTTINNN
jgi:hypothetical protein